MPKLLDTTPTLFAPAEADRVAAEMAVSDPDWRYVVRHDPAGTGYSLIDIYDEDGTFVGTV